MLRTLLLGFLIAVGVGARPTLADDLRKVEDWMYAMCIQQNFFMAGGSALNQSCRCYASEAIPFLSTEFQQAVIRDALPSYKGPKPLSDTLLGIIMMSRCPATTPLVEKMWCGPNGENPDWCMRFRSVRNGIFGGPEPWPTAPERGSAKVLSTLTQSCLKDGGVAGDTSDLQESCACFARETAPFHAQAFHDAVNSGRSYEGRDPLDDVTEIGVMGRRCPDAADVMKAKYCQSPVGSKENCDFFETTRPSLHNDGSGLDVAGLQGSVDLGLIRIDLVQRLAGNHA